MKIQNQNSVLNTGIWKIGEMSQVKEAQNTPPVSQMESSTKLVTEAQRNQRLSEFKSQEQLLRSSMQRKLSSNLNAEQLLAGTNIDKQQGGGRFQPSSLEEYDIEIEAHELLRRDILRRGRVGGLTRDDIPLIDERIDELIVERKALRALQDASQIDIRYGTDGQRDVHNGNVTSGSRPNGQAPENDPSMRRNQQAPIATPPARNEGRGRSRRPVSNSNRNSGTAPRNQKSESGPANIHYSNGGNTSSDSRESSVDNRSYSSDPPAPVPEPPEVIPDKNIKGDKQLGQDPSTGHGGDSRNDIGAFGRIPKGSPDNRSGIEQMLQPALNLFSTTTGADDKERPDTGNTQGKASNPTEGDDLGDDLPYDLSGGGSIEIHVGKVLLEQIRPINPGGPDPTKREGK